MKVARERADVLLVARGLVASRAMAQARILAGDVSTSDARVEKPGSLLALDAPLHVKAGPRFVSRGGEKLENALLVFDPLGLSLAGFVCADVGASTGGFTDCLLQRGASHVVAIDVGRAQLAHTLRNDPRVTVMEETNARELSASNFAAPIDLVVVDASFIGLSALAPALHRIAKPMGHLVALVKPQFEAGREAVRRGRGVIRDEEVRQQALENGRTALVQNGFVVLHETDSALRGPKGNLERFVWAQRNA